MENEIRETENEKGERGNE